jgi:hypothetical protein
MTTRYLGALGLALWGQVAWATGICEPLREQIEMQIAATGASGFAVVVVDAKATVEGKVVGTCAGGTRKLVYVRGVKVGGAAATSPGPRPTLPPARQGQTGRAAPAADDSIITECRDGTEVRGAASCKP